MTGPQAAPRRSRLFSLATGALLLIPVLAAAGAGFPRTAASVPPEQGQDGFPDLVSGLKEIEGCLGVETAQTTSGKNVIFAWFEDKAAATDWYYSEMHQGAMRAFFPDREHDAEHEPMAEVPENVGPVLAIASITMSPRHEVEASTLPISQIAIELYTPITGGLAVGGRFAPEGLVVPKRKVIVDDEED